MSKCRQVQVAVKSPVPFRLWLQFVHIQFLPYYLTIIDRLVNFGYFCLHAFTYCLSAVHLRLDFQHFRYVLDKCNGTGHLTAT